MDMLDLIALTGLECLYDYVENRHGRATAWIVTLAAAASILGSLIWILMRVLRH